MPKLLNGIKGDSNPGSLDCESGILPLSHRAPQGWVDVKIPEKNRYVTLDGPIGKEAESRRTEERVMKEVGVL